jgi:hypothetical protein
VRPLLIKARPIIRVLHLLEGLFVDRHAQRHQDRADPLLGLALVDFQVGGNQLNEFHGTQE